MINSAKILPDLKFHSFSQPVPSKSGWILHEQISRIRTAVTRSRKTFTLSTDAATFSNHLNNIQDSNLLKRIRHNNPLTQFGV